MRRQFGRAPILLVLSLSLLLTGCGALNLQPASDSTDSSIPMSDGPGLGSIQIAQALQDGEPLSCLLVKPDENKQMTLTLKDKKIFLTGNTLTPIGEDATLIYDTDYIYAWENGETHGVKSKLPAPGDLRVALDQARHSGLDIPDPTNPYSFAQLEATGYTISCQSVSVADGLFVPPQTVTFLDMTDTVKDLLPSSEVVL